MSEWKTYKLGDVAARITSGGTPSTRKSEYYGGNIPWLRTQEVNFNRIYDTEIKITDEAVKNSSAKIIAENSIIVAMYGATAGRIAINKIPLTTNQACCNITIDSKKADYNFVYYHLKSKFGEILNMATGAAQQNLNAGMLRDFEIQVPDLPTQRQIAQILTSLDDKIELNLQMNQTLEAMAQAIFKEWFVNFNFPGFDGELVDGLPKGWRMGKLNEVISFVKGKKPDDVSIEEQDGYLPQILIDTFNTGNSVFANPNRMVIASQEEMLMVMDGASSGRIEIGYFGIVGSTIAKIVLKNQFAFPLYIYFFLKSKEKDIMGNTTGSSIPHADKNKILDYDFVIPNKEAFQLFEETASSLLEKIKLNKSEIKSLTQIRDNLLPKLMSGKIRLNCD